ncbi:DUF5641 domain-containing protein [Nephila pilipes]|uniref:DUF5641 domain-containing protein n=1 Tax=Nephila pilipes TaxID=299642 RepID=A0A8X6UMW6_NEPPI|nr:DUF5641 domain-containing protein [Nephila pilipes]
MCLSIKLNKGESLSSKQRGCSELSSTKELRDFPETVSRLMKSFYVDNSVSSVSNKKNTLYRFIEESKHVLATACFDLRRWEHTSLKIGRDPSNPITDLGPLCNKDEDSIYFDIAVLKSSSVDFSRRNILRNISDPLDILSSATLIPKLLIEGSWNLKIGWDTILLNGYQREFSSC